MKLTDAELAQFATDGFVVIPKVVDEALLIAADAEIDELIKREPPAPGTIGKHFWFLPPDELPAAHAALRDSPALDLAEQLTTPSPLELNLDHIQSRSTSRRTHIVPTAPTSTATSNGTRTKLHRTRSRSSPACS